MPPVIYTIEGFIALNQQIMQLAMRGPLRFDFLREVSRIFLAFSDFDAVEMWLKERGRFYREIIDRSGKKQARFEIMTTEEVKGQIVPEVDSKDLGQRLCRDMILGLLDLDSEYLTVKGSFWSGDTHRLDPDQTHRSLVVIPVSIEGEIIALLQLKANAPEMVRAQDVEFYERAEQTLGLALIHRRTQVELRERIKELTCLYGIAKLVEDSDLSLPEILQGIVRLLPPAWMFPEEASARIILDKQQYGTDPFQRSDHKLASPILIDGDERGMVEVFYSQEKPELDEGPFLREERSLIDTIAREIALIVERKQTGEEKARLQEQLRHADRLATIGQLSAGVAHELNEPIGSILGFAQLIQKTPDLPEQAGRDAEKIKKASLHAREVIKKMMLFARQMPPQKAAADLNQIVDEGLYFLESRCLKEGIKVKRDLAPELPEIHADPSQMTQVLMNIVVNAIQAMPKGGTLSIQTRKSQKNVLLKIKDTGVGMNSKLKGQIFLPFFTTKDIGEGTGLGLSVVHGIVTSHGGDIDLKSEVGKGTTFTIRLPISGP